MDKRNSQHALAESIAAAAAEGTGIDIWAVELKKEGPNRYLRVFIDREGGVGVADCERIARAMQPELSRREDALDYDYFEVSSPGIERILSTDAHILKYIGERVEVRLFEKTDGRRAYTGRIASYADGALTLSLGDNGETVSLPRAAVSRIRVVADFSEI